MIKPGVQMEQDLGGRQIPDIFHFLPSKSQYLLKSTLNPPDWSLPSPSTLQTRRPYIMKRDSTDHPFTHAHGNITVFLFISMGTLSFSYPCTHYSSFSYPRRRFFFFKKKKKDISVKMLRSSNLSTETHTSSINDMPFWIYFILIFLLYA